MKNRQNTNNLADTYMSDIIIDEDTIYLFGTNTTNSGNILIFKMRSNGDIIWVKNENEKHYKTGLDILEP
ncbi:MAG: hypothetical protein R2764_07595 [Bacteroidales bacterium]